MGEHPVVTRSMGKREWPVSSAALIDYTLHKAVSMLDQTLFHYQIECSQTSATIYIGGQECTARELTTVATVIANLPRETSVLRVDLHGVISIDLQALMDLRSMLARWRTERNASVRLVLRTPLPREEWPTSAIHFERAPLRLVATSRKAELLEVVRHSDRSAASGRVHPVRSSAPLRLSVTSSRAQ